MNTILKIGTVTILLFVCGLVSAQEKENWEQHKHSIELTTGFPSFPGAYLPGVSASSQVSAESIGQKHKTYWLNNLTLTYSYRFAKRWDVSAHFNIEGTVYGVDQYPQLASGGGQYDWKATPESQGVKYTNTAIVLGTSVKYYWYQGVKCHWYSSLGVGLYLNNLGTGATFKVFPQVTPVGLHCGKNHWYFVGELGVGFTGTGRIVGAGYRF